MNSFIQWLQQGSQVVIKEINTVIGNSMSVTTFTLADNRVFVSADRALVSYNGGYYMNYNKLDETDLCISNLSREV